MANQERLAELLESSQSGLEACWNTYANLDLKLRETNLEITKYHEKVVENKI